jgi:hypothetical protein
MELETWKTEATPVFHNVENGSPIKHVHPFWHLFSIMWKTGATPVFHVSSAI